MSRPAPSPEGTCRSCKAPVYWAAYVKKAGGGGIMPIDREPSPDGNIQLFRRADGTIRATILTRKQADDLRASARVLGTEVHLRRSHFSTCAEAETWRQS